MKTSFQVTFLFSVLFLFIQCKDAQPKYMDEVANHFGDLKYQSINFPGKIKLDGNENIQLAKGIAIDTIDRTPDIYWFMAANDEGEIGDFFVGSEITSSTGSVEMSADDFISGSEKCWDISSSDQSPPVVLKRDKCLNDLFLLALIECVLAGDGTPGFSCDVDCWMSDLDCI